MINFKEIINNNFKKHKILFLFVAIITLMGLMISIPSLARLKNRNTIYSAESWDGSVATSYKEGNGSKENPYIISNGGEFAFFVKQLENTDYEGIYFELSNDIVFNSGIYKYDEIEGLKYVLDDITYYVKEYSDEYYDNLNLEGNSVGNLNTISSIKNFKGNLNGNSFTMYGIYIASKDENVALFENLEGKITDLYLSNSVIYGKGNTAGLAVNSKNSTLTNIMYDGFVINKSSSKISENIINPISINSTSIESNTLLTLPQVEIEGTIKSIKLTGEYSANNVDEINNIKINGTEILSPKFEIDLGNYFLNELLITTTSSVEGNLINFSNLKYEIEYYDDISAGIVSNTTNTTMVNVINKASIYGKYLSSGIVGKINETLQLSQSYNTGNIYSSYLSSGIVGIIKNNQNHITLSNVYNKGIVSSSLSGGIISTIINNTGLININNSINTSENYSINTVNNSIVNIVNSYSINGLSIFSGSTNGNFIQTSIENLYNKKFMNGLSYNEFISLTDSLENTSNVWIYETNSLPILYIDDLNEPIANINLNKYSWNNLSSELSIIDLTKKITFSIEEVSAIRPVKEKYYYVTNSRVPISEEELEKINSWLSYDDIVTINESGYYVIYAKIVDFDNKVTYMNTDVIALDVSGLTTNISMDNYVWSKFKTDLEEVYTNKDIKLSILAHSDLNTFNSIEYFISQEVKTKEELDLINTWNIYNDYINIDTRGKYIVYAKIVDSKSNITYINTDYIIYNGYQGNLKIGNLNKDYYSNYITSDSNIKLTFTSDFEIEFKEGYNHNLMSSILLPIGTKITLIDNNTNQIYKKVVDTEQDLYNYNNSCEEIFNCVKYATYKFEEFKKIGVLEELYYDDKINYNETISNEKYTILIDLSNANITENFYDVSFYISLNDSNNNVLYQTLSSTIDKINIYSKISEQQVKTIYKINSDYNNQIIYYNSDSQLDINFNKEVIYSQINDKNIIDTTYETKKAGLIVGLYDELGNSINKTYLDNMIFEISEKEYFATNDNLIKIDLGRITDNEVKTLKIKTKENSSNLPNGNYYIKINKFISDDGYYYENFDQEEIVIPLIVNNETPIISNYSFDVQMTPESVILDKKLDKYLIPFSVTYSGGLIEPNIRVSLYEKKSLTAYDQEYTLINLSNYVSDTLHQVSSNKYYVDILNPTLNLNIIPNKFNNNGYKYVFELYDGTKKISKIEKYFIVK